MQQDLNHCYTIEISFVVSTHGKHVQPLHAELAIAKRCEELWSRFRTFQTTLGSVHPDARTLCSHSTPPHMVARRSEPQHMNDGLKNRFAFP